MTSTIIEWLTPEQAAEHLCISPRTLRRWEAEGKITGYEVDGIRSARYRRDELDDVFQPKVRTQ